MKNQKNSDVNLSVTVENLASFTRIQLEHQITKIKLENGIKMQPQVDKSNLQQSSNGMIRLARNPNFHHFL